MTYLDNGEVRIGMDLSLGGAVTFIATKDRPGNLINSADLGRQIQMSHYSGPWPFVAEGKKPHESWAGLGWNPIQTGDCYMNPSKVIEHRNSGKELYIKCVPMQWPMNNVPGDCTFETWTRLDGPLIHMRFRCVNARADTNAYRPCPQELPAVYTISSLSRLMSYTGETPFDGGPLTHVTNDWRKSWPWTRFHATERWAALVNEQDWGLGVFKDDGGEFHGGIHGQGPSDDPKHASTAYVAPIHVENFDHNIIFEHSTVFMVGKLGEMRRRFNAMATRAGPRWEFEKDRRHWVLRRGSDQGFPLSNEWRATSTSDGLRLESPTYAWRAERSGALVLHAASVGITNLTVSWKRLGEDRFDALKRTDFALIPDGKYSAYRVNLAEAPKYHGLIVGLAIETKDLGELRIKSIHLEQAEK